MRIGHLPNPTGLCVLKKILQFTWREISELRSECGIRDASHIRSSGVWWGAIYTPHSRHKTDVNCCRATYMQYLFPVQSTNITLSNLHQVGRQVNGLSQLEAHCSQSALMCSANRDFLENLWHAFDRREGTQRVWSRPPRAFPSLCCHYTSTTFCHRDFYKMLEKNRNCTI